MSIKQLNFAGKDRVEVAIMRLQEFEPAEGYNLAFSGGKDSVTIYDLAKRSRVKFHAFYNWTGIDPPGLFRFVKEKYPEVELRRPKKSMWRLIEEHGCLPTRKIRFCCEDLKESDNTDGFLITGIRWAESSMRKNRSMVEVSVKNRRVVFVHPIIDWADDEVWEYIRIYNVPYCSLYDEGFKRLGCILCPFGRGKQLQLEMKRYPKHVAMWKRASDRLFVRDHISKKYQGKGFKSADEMFDWWISREARKEDDTCQGVMFV